MRKWHPLYTTLCRAHLWNYIMVEIALGSMCYLFSHSMQFHFEGMMLVKNQIVEGLDHKLGK